MNDYRGPYFRTGLDGAGNRWELSDRVIPHMNPLPKKQDLKRVPMPQQWDLVRPLSLTENFTPNPNKSQSLVPYHNSMKSTLNPGNSVLPPGGSQFGKLSNSDGKINLGKSKVKSTIGSNVFICKDYLKDMLTEIWKDSNPPVPKPCMSRKPNKSTKSTKREKLEASSLKAAQKDTSRNNIPTQKSVIAIREQPITTQLSVRPWSLQDEKRRMFEYFRKISIDPPKTPPQGTATFSASEAEILDISGKNRVKTSKSVSVTKAAGKSSKARRNSSDTQRYPQIPYDPTLLKMGIYHQNEPLVFPSRELYTVLSQPSAKPKKLKTKKSTGTGGKGNVLPVFEKTRSSSLTGPKVSGLEGWYNGQKIEDGPVKNNTSYPPIKKKTGKKKLKVSLPPLPQLTPNDDFKELEKFNWTAPKLLADKRRRMLQSYVRSVKAEKDVGQLAMTRQNISTYPN